jgi:RNA polymerase sigma factor (sigma-70 family)
VEVPEHELLVILERGDASAAIEWLIHAHDAELRAFIAGRLPRWARPWGIDEIRQEVWADAFRHLASYRREGPARGWLFGIAGHKIVDLVRRHRRLAPLEDVVSKLVEASTRRPSRALARAERLRTAAAILEALEPEKRTLVAWRYGEGLKPAQILERIVREGRAAEVDLEPQVRALSASEGDLRKDLEKKLINAITQRIHRAVLQVIELWKQHEGSPPVAGE